MTSYHGNKCLEGYPGLTYVADKISRYIPFCDTYVEPFAGLGRVAHYVKFEHKSKKIILNDMSDYAIQYLKKYFKYAEITQEDYIKCIKKHDSEHTFFLIDPPYRTSLYALNDKAFIDRTDTEYFNEIKGLLPKLKSSYILCSDSSRTGNRIFRNSNLNKIIVESDNNIIFGLKSKILLISNKPFTNNSEINTNKIMELLL